MLSPAYKLSHQIVVKVIESVAQSQQPKLYLASYAK